MEEKNKRRKLLFKIGIPVLIVLLIGVGILLYFCLKPTLPTGPGGPRQVWYEYETFEEMQEAVDNMEYEENDFFLKLDFDDVVAWQYQMTGIDYCGEKVHSREEGCNKLRSRRYTIKGSYDGEFKEQNQFFSIFFCFSSLLAKDSILKWTSTPRMPINGNPEYDNTSFHLSNENGKDIVSIGFYNISDEYIQAFTQKIEELVYEFLEQNK